MSDLKILSKEFQLSEKTLLKSGLFNDTGNLKRRSNSDGITKVLFRQKMKVLLNQSPVKESISNVYNKELISSMYENLSGSKMLKTKNLKQVDYKVTKSSNRQSVS